MTHNSQTRSKLSSPMWRWNNKHAPVCVIHDVTSRVTTAATQRISIVSVDDSKQFFSYLSVLRSIYNDDDERRILNLHLHWDVDCRQRSRWKYWQSLQLEGDSSTPPSTAAAAAAAVSNTSHPPPPLYAQNNYFLWPVDGSLQFVNVHLIQIEVQSAEFSRQISDNSPVDIFYDNVSWVMRTLSVRQVCSTNEGIVLPTCINQYRYALIDRER